MIHAPKNCTHKSISLSIQTKEYKEQKNTLQEYDAPLQEVSYAS